MDTTASVVSALLAVAFIAAGAMKLSRPKEKLIEAGMGWAGDFSDRSIKLIGTAEILGSIGLILPWALDILPILTPIAASALVLLMIGAALTHLRRKEPQLVAVNAVLLLLAAFVAIVRFTS